MLQPELLVKSEKLSSFIAFVHATIAKTSNSKTLVSRLTDPFTRMLFEDFIPTPLTQTIPNTFAQYLLYRSFRPELSLMAMVVPSGIATPVHDHMAWGLVGVYQGEQKENVYSYNAILPSTQSLVLKDVHSLRRGDVTSILPPENDIHMIETTSEIPSISLHLLATDIGCKIRHTYDLTSGAMQNFQSGYANAECKPQKPSETS